MTDHVLRETLQLMADGELAEEAARPVKLHLKTCESCRKVYQSLAQFDRLMRAVPVRALPRDFAAGVLSRLGIQQRPPFLFLVLEHFASLVAVCLVAAMSGTVWALLALPRGQDPGSQTMSHFQVLEGVGKWMETSWGEFAGWMQHALPRLPQAQAAKIFMMIILMAFVVAVIDRVVQRRGAAGRP
jgi:predicted anti-sigma-YlaC factor YlaD